VVKVCACCGHPMPEYDALSGLTQAQQRIFNVLEKVGQAGITRNDLFERIYGDDPDGGPDSRNILNVQRTKMQRGLAKHGLRIVAQGGHYSLWRLEKI